MNERFGSTGTRHDPSTVELQPIGVVVPGKVEGDQENETHNRDDNPNPGRPREEQGVVRWVIALSRPRSGGRQRAGPNHGGCYELADCAARPLPEPTLPARQALYRHRTGAAIKMEL